MTAFAPHPHTWQDRKVVITGGAGFIGAHLSRSLVAAGADVTVVDDFSATPLLPGAGTLVQQDVVGLSAQLLDGADTVYHLAANKSVPRSFTHPGAAEYNFDMTKTVLDAAIGANVRRVISASTCEVYGAAESIPTPETTDLKPRSPYAASKARAEQYALDRSLNGRGQTQITSVRLFNVYGPGERPDAVIPRICVSWLLGVPFPIEGDGTQRRDFSFITDTVRRLVALADTDPVPILNLGSGESHSIHDLLSTFNSLVERPVETSALAARTNEIAEFRASRRLERRILGEDERVALAVGLQETIAWWRTQGAQRAEEALKNEEEE